MKPPATLILGYGNPGRLDDGLGPALAARVEAIGLPGVDAATDYQLNIEHAERISRYGRVVFADATVAGPEPFFFRRLLPRTADSFSSHVVRPEAVLALARDLFGWEGRAYLLGIRGNEFDEYDERLSAGALANLAAAERFLERVLPGGSPEEHTTDGPIDDSVAHCYGGEPCKTAST